MENPGCQRSRMNWNFADILLSSHPKKMDAKDAINLYKSRDVSEKVFQADKSYLGNHGLRVAPEEAHPIRYSLVFLH